MSDLIKFADDMHPRQITRGRNWLETEKYDVTGKPDLAENGGRYSLISGNWVYCTGAVDYGNPVSLLRR
jgi:Protein of unknown function (DUF3738)